MIILVRKKLNKDFKIVIFIFFRFWELVSGFKVVYVGIFYRNFIVFFGRSI